MKLCLFSPAGKTFPLFFCNSNNRVPRNNISGMSSQRHFLTCCSLQKNTHPLFSWYSLYCEYGHTKCHWYLLLGLRPYHHFEDEQEQLLYMEGSEIASENRQQRDHPQTCKELLSLQCLQSGKMLDQLILCSGHVQIHYKNFSQVLHCHPQHWSKRTPYLTISESLTPRLPLIQIGNKFLLTNLNNYSFSRWENSPSIAPISHKILFRNQRSFGNIFKRNMQCLWNLNGHT